LLTNRILSYPTPEIERREQRLISGSKRNSNRPDVQSQHPGAGNMIAGSGAGGGPPPPGYPPQGPGGLGGNPGAQGGMGYK